MPEKADQEQLANVTELLRVMTYSRGWQGVDGPPDPESKPFADWDGVAPHWRGDARRAEELNRKSAPETAADGSGSTAAEQTGEEVTDTEVTDTEGGLEENVVHVQTVDDAEVLPPEEVPGSLCVMRNTWIRCPVHRYCRESLYF